jgi:hypothetical protein
MIITPSESFENEPCPEYRLPLSVGLSEYYRKDALLFCFLNGPSDTVCRPPHSAPEIRIKAFDKTHFARTGKGRVREICRNSSLKMATGFTRLFGRTRRIPTVGVQFIIIPPRQVARSRGTFLLISF